MKSDKRKLPVNFAQAKPFDVAIVHSPASRQITDLRFEELRNGLFCSAAGETKDPDFQQRLRWAADEASSLAWDTGYPLLIFPVLFLEKVEAANRQYLRQRRIRRRSQPLTQMLQAA